MPADRLIEHLGVDLRHLDTTVAGSCNSRPRIRARHR